MRILPGLLAMSLLTAASHAQSPLTPPTHNCSVNHVPPFPAEQALAREEFADAEKQYRAILAQHPTDPRSRAGLVRALLQQNKLPEATTEAEAFSAATPSPLATETMSELRFRRGELPESYQLAAKALVADPCNARAILFQALYETLSGYHATSQSHIKTAYKLDPMDDEIHRQWLSTLSHNQRVSAIRAYLATDAVSEKRRKRMQEYLDHESEHHAGDCTAVNPQEATKVNFTTITDGPTEFIAYGLPAQFNGKSRSLQIDTGASGIILSKSAAARLGLTRQEHIQSSGIGDKGDVASSTAHVESLRVGGVEFRNCEIDILEKDSALPAVDGLIGMDIFDRYLVTLDFPAKQLRLDALPPRPGETPAEAKLSEDNDSAPVRHDPFYAPEMKDWTHIFRDGHLLLLPTFIAESSQKLFVVDTGTNTNLISPAAAREVTKVRGNSGARLMGLSGEVDKVLQADKLTVVFAGLRQPLTNVLSIDTAKTSHSAGVEIGGFFGLPTLSLLVMHIDYRDNLIKFDYKSR